MKRYLRGGCLFMSRPSIANRLSTSRPSPPRRPLPEGYRHPNVEKAEMGYPEVLIVLGDPMTCPPKLVQAQR